MAWAEAALEEMGLAQIWVRRGQGAEEGTDEGAAADAHAAAQTGAAHAAPAVATERPARIARTPAQDEAPPAVARS
ncbi:uracil-DNA glycosylase, partial [Burkholderia sp. Ac-20384]|nr:uracil-DNA glycosylase [Burkholderia sp. Ac-20384]